MSRPLRVAVYGGVPASLGGGGLEVQVAETMAALTGLGHEVFHVSLAAEPRPFDLLHVFGSDTDAWHVLHHWRRNPAPLVVSAVAVVSPGAAERRLRVGAKLPIPGLATRMRREVLTRADLVIALTRYERGVLEGIAGGLRVEVVGNGVAAVAPGPLPDGLPVDFVLLLGTVSARKRQAATLRALGRPAVVAGGFQGDGAERAEWEAAVRDTQSVWLGEVTDPGVVRALLVNAAALVHLSAAEGQSLAVLESLAAGTPVVASPLPSNSELAQAHPGWVRLVDGPDQIAAALSQPTPATAPAVPSWDDVAARLDALYADLV